MNYQRKIPIIVIFAVIVSITIGVSRTLGQKPTAAGRPDPIVELRAKIAALENATVEVSYGQCRLLPEGNNRYDPRNAENRIIRCGDGEVFNSWITGVNSPVSEVKINCCKIITKIVPRRP